jgi:hypothetical protein
VLAPEIAEEDLEAALEKFAAIAEDLKCRPAPLPATLLEPVLNLLRYIVQTVASHPLGVAIGIKETDLTTTLLKLKINSAKTAL